MGSGLLAIQTVRPLLLRLKAKELTSYQEQKKKPVD